MYSDPWAKYNKPKEGWQCSYCFVYTPHDQNVCLGCEQAKPGTEAASAAGFTFGVPAGPAASAAAAVATDSSGAGSGGISFGSGAGSAPAPTGAGSGDVFTFGGAATAPGASTVPAEGGGSSKDAEDNESECSEISLNEDGLDELDAEKGHSADEEDASGAGAGI